MTKVFGDFPTIPPRNNDTRNNADAIADVPRTLAANCLTHYVHVTGDDTVGAGKELISPSGNYGHDHSGGIWGKPFKSTVASFSNATLDDFNGSTYGGLSTLKKTFTLEPSSSERGNIGDIRLYIPPCDSIKGAFNSLAVALTTVHPLVTNVSSSDEIRLEIRNLTTGDSVNFSYTTFSSAYSRKISRTLTSDEYLNFKAGYINHLMFEAKLTTTASAGTRVARMNICEVEFGVI